MAPYLPATPDVPASTEVLAHRWDRHDASCGCGDVPPAEDPCPCGTCLLLRCGCCGDMLFLVLPEDGEPCAHGRLAWALHGHLLGAA